MVKYRGEHVAPVRKAQEDAKPAPAGPPAFKQYADTYFLTKTAANKRFNQLAEIVGKEVGDTLRPLRERIAALEAEVEVLKRSHDIEARIAKLEGKRK